ncbi:hypothetical protein AVEN_80592-1 [Araneus ventricosus]|uniref:Uncharacterized protein n=1 Tax=Araneus ventricosus TaxID=182803 RepID=A0A4Y2FI00_ARAVE|nr:hypothetical protein AVEN_80592-1 [Araneus ventricosus]
MDNSSMEKPDIRKNTLNSILRCSHRTCFKVMQRCSAIQHDSSARNDSISTKVVDFPHVGLLAVDTTLSLSPDEDNRESLCVLNLASSMKYHLHGMVIQHNFSAHKNCTRYSYSIFLMLERLQ